MIGAEASLGLAPLVPWWLLGALGAVTAAVLGLGALRRAPGTAWRTLGAGALLAALLNPSLVLEDREPLDDIAVVLVDESRSQTIGRRRERTDAALADIEAALAGRPGIALKVARSGASESGMLAGEDGGTRLMATLARALGDVPRRRLAGVVAITDGQVHDTAAAEALGVDAPFHVLLTGERDEGDRRLVIEEAPAYGIVGRPIEVRLRVEDLPAADADRAWVTMRQDGSAEIGRWLPVGASTTVEIELEHAGPSVVEIEVEPGPWELTTENNRGVLVVNGVRDRLRVLLVSGEPHPGERTWRNLLKSDPAVDLIHFTILRAPDKQDHTPIRELSLITFPTYELFEAKLNDFDLIIFDRYRRRGVLALGYFNNLVEYVEKGGAILVAVGPTFGGAASIYNTPLGTILPAEPTGRILESGYKPALTALGRRHPVTAALTGGEAANGPRWGRWLRQIEATTRSGVTLMEGIEGRPLLLLDRVGEGRVALLMSDHLWLWARGFEGGGPQSELLRRVAHWLMKEPELEEDALHAAVRGDRLEVVRRSLRPSEAPVIVRAPSGAATSLRLTEDGTGRATGSLPVSEPGLYRVSDDRHAALAAAGPLNARELADPRTSIEPLAPLLARTGGGLVWLATEAVPDFRRIRPGRDSVGSAGGRTWLGLRINDDYVVRGLTRAPLLPGVLVLALALGALMLAWRREGR